ncbi:MAG: mitochondrial fission ELM1 family protein [Marinicellaceae bacterium]
MEKLNHIWVFSDSIVGHEIQSIALAQKVSNTMEVFHCGLRQPWLSFSPRILPGFAKNIIWSKQKPNPKQPLDAIITCGRRMAAVGKYYKRLTNTKHIQILNPTDSVENYDVIVCPEHDNLLAPNVIQIKGSLHAINTQYLLPYKKPQNKSIGILLGNPSKHFFNNIELKLNQINESYPHHDLYVCGSRRTPKRFFQKIKKACEQAKVCWLDETDGTNPYLSILANSDVLMVTADSINMVSEACATDKTVIILAKNQVSLKHKRFVNSLQERLSAFGVLNSRPIPLNTLTQGAQQVLLKLKNDAKKSP